MSDIAENILLLKQQLPASIKLVAVSKTQPASEIMEAYNAGQICFAENRVQELLNKKDLLPGNIEWHLIGHLQRNKVRFIVPFISMIQSVDSFKLLSAINYESSKINRIVDCLLQIHIAAEEAKFGFSMKEIEEMVESADFINLKFVRLCGVMGMATFTSDTRQISKEFRTLAYNFNILKNKYFTTDPDFKEISMGMSGDYEMAMKEGSTIVRIGSLLFGERNKIQ